MSHVRVRTRAKTVVGGFWLFAHETCNVLTKMSQNVVSEFPKVNPTLKMLIASLLVLTKISKFMRQLNKHLKNSDEENMGSTMTVVEEPTNLEMDEYESYNPELGVDTLTSEP